MEAGRLTFMWTESVLPIFLEVVGCGAPEESVVASLRGTACVLLTHEEEGELTELALRVPKLNLHH